MVLRRRGLWHSVGDLANDGGGGSLTFVYYHQFLLTVSFALSEGGAFTAPTFSFTQFGGATTFAATSTSTGVWADDSQPWSFTNPLTGSTGTERAEANAGTSGTVSAAATLAPTYYHQFLQTLSYSVVYGGSPSAPTAAGQQYGSAYSPSLTTSAAGYWFDATGSISPSTPTNGPNERWSPSPSTISATQSNAQVFSMYNQYQQTLSYSVSGGGSGYSAPIGSGGAQLGSSYAPTLTTSPTGYWFDATGTVSVTNPLAGSSSSERWQTSASTTTIAVATSASTMALTYYHQYSFSLAYAVLDGGSPTAPTLTYTQFGGSLTPTLTTGSTGYWLDSGQPWGVTNPLGGSGASERWQSGQTVSGTVSSSSPTSAGGSQTFSYYNQFLQTLSYSVIDGGSPIAPTATGQRLGSAYAPTLTTSATAYWFDATGALTVSTPTGADEQWVPSPGSISATQPNAKVFSLYHQYQQTLSYSVVDGGSPTAPTAAGTSLGGAYSPSLTTSPATYWFDAAGTITVSTPTSGANERWAPNPASVSATTASGTQVFSMYHQYNEFLSYSVTYGGSGYSAPTGTGLELGAVYAPTLGTVSTGYWFDASGTISFPSLLGGSSSSERWHTATTSASATMQSTTTVAYYHQFLLTVTGGNNLTYGTASPTSDSWYDSGAATAISSNGVYGRGSGTGQRVASWNVDGGSNTNVATSGAVTTSTVTMSTYHTVNFNSATQYQLTLSAAAASALVSCTLPAIANDNYWYDSGTTASCTLQGVYGRSGGTGTRVTSYNWDGGAPTSEATTGTFTTTTQTMSATHQINANTVAQYQVSLDSGATGAISSMTAPTVAGDNYWYDSGSAMTVTLNGAYGRSGGSGSRISSFALDGGAPTNEAMTGTFSAYSTASIAAPHSITTAIVTQYLLTDNDASGSESSITSPTIPGDAGWYDSGTRVTVVLNNIHGLVPNTSRDNLLSYTQGGSPPATVTRSGSGTVTEPALTMNAPLTISSTYAVQYYLAVSSDCYSALVSATSPTGDGWYDSGTSLNVQCNGINTRGGGTGKRAQDYYWDSGSLTTEATTGPYTTSSATMSSAHTLQVDAIVQYQVTFASNPASAGSASTSSSPLITGDTGWYDSGTTIDVAASPNAFWSFTSWSASSGSITFGSASSASTTATIGATGTMTAAFAVTNPLAAGGITPSSPSIDNGQSITLAANPSGGTGVYSYRWYTGASCTSPISGATASTYDASPTSTTPYYYKVTDSSSAGAMIACSAGNTVTVSSGGGGGGGGGGGAVAVVQPVTFSPSGGVAATLIVTGCDASPSSFLGDGQPHHITASAYCIFTVSLANAGNATTRQAFAAGMSSIRVTTCGIGTCPNYVANYYQQHLVSFQVTAKGQPTFDSALFLTMNGTQFGSEATGLCQIVTMALPTANCQAWVDAPSSVYFPATLAGAPANIRWERASSSSSAAVTSASTINVDYYKQASMLLAYSVFDGGGEPTPPTLTCTQLGLSMTCGILAESPTSYWLDFESSWSAPALLAPSSGNERWVTASASKGIQAGSSFTISYYHQYLQELNYSVSGLSGGYSPPAVSGLSLGSPSTRVLTTSQAGYWFDSSGTITIPGELPGSIPTTQWILLPSSASIDATLPHAASYHFFQQFMVSFLVSPPGSGSVAPPSGWYNASSTIAIQARSNGSTGFSAWISGKGATVFGSSSSSTTAKILGPDTVTAFFESAPQFVSQTITLYGGSGGLASQATVALSGCSASPASFSVVGNVTQTLSIEAGCTFNLSLPPAGAADRYVFNGGNSSLQLTACSQASRCLAISVTYFRQSELSFGYSVSSGSPSPPTVTYASFGVASNVALTTVLQAVWADYGSHWAASSQLLPPGAQEVTTEAWLTSQPVNGTVTGPLTESLSYSHAYQVTFLESGLPPGGPWGVSFDSMNQTSVSSSISFLAVEGAHTWNVSSTPLRVGTGMYAASVMSGTVNLPTDHPITLEFNNLVPIALNVDSDSQVQPVVVNPSFQVSTAWVSGNLLRISISNNETGVGLRLVHIDLNSSVIHGLSPDSLQVALDGALLNRSASLEQLLNFQAPAETYLVAVTSTGYEIIVSIPHFSSHVIELSFPATTTASSPTLSLSGILAGLLVTTFVTAVAVAFVYGRSSRKKKPVRE